ncbi:ABC transporter permease [Pseudogracilibacillus auburnensis]|uniref:ABC transporter permease n=1 Tax=Pseudogracilibacillus auburnensis TaxID=1494959 RepID=UPI001A97787F|nr:ABC transporter permease [Pseudogracilibacillus auburnensis]MBO1002342.1 ABC transporter permease [Pseudogracilibacillus auburnensis]
MTFRQFAFNNVFRNKRLYVAYFLSSLFTVMVFFTFLNFAFHPGLTGDDMNVSVAKGMSVAGGIIYVFSFFFILYSMSSFLQSRKREFGVLIIQGMSNRQIRWMVFLENMLIGFFATVFGIALGLVFAKGILLVAENVLVMEGSLHFYMPIKALVVTFISFMILFLCISIFVTFVLRTKKLVTLIKGDKIGKSEPKASIILTVLAVLLLGSGYAIAVYVKGVAVVAALLPVVILVTVGTYLLFTQLSVFIIRKLKNNENLFWKKTNMLLFSDLSYRMKDNARAFFMVAIISTVAFSAIGTLVGLKSYLTTGVKEANPIAFTLKSEVEDISNEDITLIEDIFAEHQITYDKSGVDLAYFSQKEGDHDLPTLITTPSTYNAFAKLIGEKEITLENKQVITVGQSSVNMMPEKELKRTIVLEDGTNIKVDNKDIGAKPDVLPEVGAYYIVSEHIFQQLPEPAYENTVIGWQVKNGKKEDLIAAGEKISNELPYQFMAVDSVVYDMNKMWGPIMFVGLFIGIVFFVSAGSFLYFRLYTDLDEDKMKFTAISKIGLTISEMNGVISKQITILFFAPIIVAIIHGAVALTALSHMFGYNLVRESALVLSSFFVIQVAYFIIVRYFYTKQVRLAVK